MSYDRNIDFKRKIDRTMLEGIKFWSVECLGGVWRSPKAENKIWNFNDRLWPGSWQQDRHLAWELEAEPALLLSASKLGQNFQNGSTNRFFRLALKWASILSTAKLPRIGDLSPLYMHDMDTNIHYLATTCPVKHSSIP